MKISLPDPKMGRDTVTVIQFLAGGSAVSSAIIITLLKLTSCSKLGVLPKINITRKKRKKGRMGGKKISLLETLAFNNPLFSIKFL